MANLIHFPALIGKDQAMTTTNTTISDWVEAIIVQLNTQDHGLIAALLYPTMKLNDRQAIGRWLRANSECDTPNELERCIEKLRFLLNERLSEPFISP